jgi:hypothetical protein
VIVSLLYSDVTLSEEEADEIQSIVSNQENIILAYSNEVHIKDTLISSQSNYIYKLREEQKKERIKHGAVWFLRGLAAAVIGKLGIDYIRD